jgi:hypothetical protein
MSLDKHKRYKYQIHLTETESNTNIYNIMLLDKRIFKKC